MSLTSCPHVDVKNACGSALTSAGQSRGLNERRQVSRDVPDSAARAVFRSRYVGFAPALEDLKCSIEPRCHGSRISEHSTPKAHSDRIGGHRYCRRPDLNAPENERDDQGINTYPPISASIANRKPAFEVGECLFKSPSIVFEGRGFFFDEVPGRIDPGLIDEKSRALARTVDYLVRRIDG
jgi:hypothetical protein